MTNLLANPLTVTELRPILERHPVKSPLPPLGDARWARTLANPRALPVLDAIRAREAAERDEPLPALTDDLYRDYHRTGLRLPFECVYYERRRRVARAAVALLAAGAGDGQRAAIAQSFTAKFRAIVSEESWALPAHIKNPALAPAGRDPLEIDLFGAETANFVGECLAVFGSVIPQDLRATVSARLHREFFDNYLADSTRFWWTQWTNNWVAVCHQGLLGAALAVADHETVARLLEHAAKYLAAYLGSFGDDGGCEEGPAYWGYGFGWFAILSEQLEARAGGELTLLAGLAKTAAIAKYGPAVSWRGGRVVNFADCVPDAAIRPAILQYLGRRLGDAACLRQAAANYAFILSRPPDLDAQRADLFQWLRFFLLAPNAGTDPAPPTVKPDAYFADLQEWMVTGGDASGHAWELAAKGGHNGVPHNHNDLGSFILNIDGHSFVSEIGAPMYTAQTFSPRRYELLATRTLGHSLPIINGCEQAEGRQYRAVILSADGDRDTVTFAADLATAYPAAAGVEKFTRALTLHKRAGRLDWLDEITTRAGGTCASALITAAADVHIEHPARALIRQGPLTLKLTAVPGAEWTRVERHEYDAHDGTRAIIHRLVMQPREPTAHPRLGATLELA
ncbi:MAG: heparinase II/III-family protein [Verrucomicrobiales bacterium]|jgi:hypothetical protein|nr:heparinase II/III-family protein [Verrucomicrobiales bacterium]